MTTPFSIELESLLALTTIKGVGNKTLIKLIDHFGSAEKVIQADREVLQKINARPALLKALDDFAMGKKDSQLQILTDKVQQFLSDPSTQLHMYGQEDYPPLLAEIPDPPAFIFSKGKADLLHLPQVAIVGSRNASYGAKQNAKQIAQAISEAGIAVTSGFALGVDTAAHEGALQSGSGSTVAVMGTGVDQCYPARNQRLYQQVAEQGVMISELMPGVGPHRSHFPSRNRIISGLSLGVLVVEAGLKSGSLISARMASEQGREVFAIPGSIHHPLAKGCHYLIKQGAKLTEDVNDILEELESSLQFHYSLLNASTPVSNQPDVPDSIESKTHKSAPKPAPQSDLFEAADEHPILQLIGSDTLTPDDIIMSTGLSPSQVLEQLFDLEMAGNIVAVSGGYRRLA